jgi:hypothetical protein
MFGLSFIHAGFLAAGLAVALPIVIHLLFRQKTRVVPIGSVRFLHQVVREHRRRRRVRQWILLSLRMLAVALLAFLFARPYFDEAFRRGLRQEVVFLVDRSASMTAQDSQGETAFQRAVAKLREQLKGLDENVVVHVAFCDAAGIGELPVEKLGDAQTSEAATDYGLALAWASDVLAASSRSSRRIVLITDLQRSGLPRARPEPLADGVELAVHDVGEALAHNLAIESAEAVRTEIRPDSKVLVRAVLHNHGPLPFKQVPLTCELEGPRGKIRLSQAVDVPGLATKTVDLPLDIQTDGLYWGQVGLRASDALQLDNRRWLALEARHPERLLLVDGEEGRSVYNNETYFLETALGLRTEQAGGTLRSFETERIVWESGEGFPRLDGYRAVVLANVRRLSDADGERLAQYVRGGGSLLVFAGEQVSRQSLAPLQKNGLLPGRVATAPIAGRLRVDEWDPKHAALACFADPQQGDLRRVEFSKVLPLESPTPEARVLFSSGGRAVAAELAVGRGRTIYFGTTADREWTDLPRTRMYVPLVRQLLAYLTDQLADRAAVTSRLVARPGERAGLSMDGERCIVTNLDPRESALARATSDELYSALNVQAPHNDRQEELAQLALLLPRDALRPDEIWTALVWLLFAVLAAELLLAGRVHA